MYDIEQITKIIANIMALSAIPTLGIAIAKYFYEKNKDTANKVKNGYMPLYEYFFRERFSNEYLRHETAILIRSTGDSLYDLIKNTKVIDKSLLPFKLVKLLCEFEFYMDIVNSGLEYLSAYEYNIKDTDPNDELSDIAGLKTSLADYYSYGIVINSSFTSSERLEGVLANDYISMIEHSLSHVKRLYREIECNVFKVIGTPEYSGKRNLFTKSAELLSGHDKDESNLKS